MLFLVQRWLEKFLQKLAIQEAKFDGCSGWKSPDECPHNGVFDPTSSACKECAEDVMKAYDEALIDIEK